MRYESKNKFFKHIAVTLGNFINVEKTVANRHQRFMCYKMECSTNFLGGDTSYGCGTLWGMGGIKLGSRVRKCTGGHSKPIINFAVISTPVDDLCYKDDLIDACPNLDSTIYR